MRSYFVLIMSLALFHFPTYGMIPEYESKISCFFTRKLKSIALGSNSIIIGQFYPGIGTQEFSACDAKTDLQLWEKVVPLLGHSSTHCDQPYAVYGSKLYVPYNYEGKVQVIDQKTGARIHEIQLGLYGQIHSMGITSHGLLYLLKQVCVSTFTNFTNYIEYFNLQNYENEKQVNTAYKLIKTFTSQAPIGWLPQKQYIVDEQTMFTQECANCFHFFDAHGNEAEQSAIAYPHDPLIRIRDANVYFLNFKKEIVPHSSHPITIDCYNSKTKTCESLLSFQSSPTDMQISSKQNTLVVASPHNTLEAYDIASKNIKWKLNLLSLKLCSECLQMHHSDIYEKLYFLKITNGMVHSIDFDNGLHLDTCTIKTYCPEDNYYKFLSVLRDRVYLQRFDFLRVIHETHV